MTNRERFLQRGAEMRAALAPGLSWQACVSWAIKRLGGLPPLLHLLEHNPDGTPADRAAACDALEAWGELVADYARLMRERV